MVENKTLKKNSKKPHLLYYFSTDWCNYCKAFNPTWKKLTQKIKHENIHFEKIMIDETNEHLLTTFNIETFPTVLLIKNNKKQIIYNSDDRSISKMIAFLKENKVINKD